MVRGIVIAVLLLLTVACFLSVSTTTTTLSVHLGPEGDAALRRDRILEFARTHDWEAEFSSAGLSIPAKLAEQAIAPLRDGLAEHGSSLASWQVRVIHRGIPDSVVGPGRLERACRLLESRLSVECDIIRVEQGAEVELRRHLSFDIYGSGFDERAREFFAARSLAETDPELRALCEDLRGRLERALAERRAAPLQSPHSQRP